MCSGFHSLIPSIALGALTLMLYMSYVKHLLDSWRERG
jgi:hypothetical protein